MATPLNANNLSDSDSSDEDSWIEDDDENGSLEELIDESCSICLSNFTDQIVAKPDCCQHCFCLPCINEWSKLANSCPVDRATFQTLRIFPTINHDQIDVIAVEKINEETDDSEPDLTYCEVCHQCNREDRLLLCDGCNKGYHCECLTPPLEHIPIDDWFCPDCIAVHDTNVTTDNIQQETSGSLIASESRNRNSLDNDENELQTIPSFRNIRHRKRKRISKKRTRKSIKRSKSGSKKSRKRKRTRLKKLPYRQKRRRKLARTVAGRHVQTLLDKVRNNLKTKKLLPSKSTSKSDVSGNLPGKGFVAGPSVLGITTDNGLLPLYPSEDTDSNYHDQDRNFGVRGYGKGSKKYMETVIAYHSSQHNHKNRERNNKPETASPIVDYISKITQEIDNLRHINKASVLPDGSVMMQKTNDPISNQINLETSSKKAASDTSDISHNVCLSNCSKSEDWTDKYESPNCNHSTLALTPNLNPQMETSIRPEIFHKVKDTVRSYAKPYFRHGDIDKNDYKVIVKKAVDKVYKSVRNDPGRFKAEKIKLLIKQYVGKFLGHKIASGIDSNAV